MRKSIIIASLAGLLIIAINLIVFRDLYNKQFNYQKNILFGQADLCGSNIERVLQRFESDLNFILFSDDISELFLDEAEHSNSLRKLELFYSSYSSLIKNIDIYDNNKNVFNLFKDKKFITDKYIAQRQRKLVNKEQVKIRENEFHYFIPVFKDNQVYGNIVITINLSKYILAELNKFHIEDICYQWIIDLESSSFTTNFAGGKESEISDFEQILENLNNGFEGLLRHQVTYDSVTTQLVTAYKPLSVLDHNFGLGFSFNNNFFIKQVFSKITLVALASILLFLISLIIILRQIRRNEKRDSANTLEIDRLKGILLNLPIGVIAFDDNDKILYLNQLAREMFLIKEGEELNGNVLTEKYLQTGKRDKQHGKPAAYDTNQFILYEKEGNEVVLYRREFPYLIGTHEHTLSAFIDITSIEKARKYEAAANTAKSEFLAKMSHEIRTPMNGIIGMTEALNQQSLTKEQLEYVEIVKRSADLLLNIIDDILDYSKIEAGKMQLEEIPFRLYEEVKLALDLFRAIIEEKGLQLILDIDEDVPDNVIGDPFRLRQVLSNLISNAVKFTHEGEIHIVVSVDEKYNGNLTLLFEVVDTGVGIPQERLDSIFSSFTQADRSTSRKYGGSGLGTTISKQLVNLMNGEIWVESPSGISKNKKFPGSKFSFTTEVFSNEELEKDLDFSKVESFSDVHVFLIAQNLPTKKRIISFLNHLSIKVTTVELEGEKDIIESIQKQLETNTYQLILIMDDPNLDGLWIARQLSHQKITEKYRCIMISSKHDHENYIQTKVARIDYYLTQPFEQNILKNYLYKWFPAIQKIEENKSVSLQKDISILVAEDNAINQKVAETIFGNMGYTIDIAHNGKEAVELVKKKSFDIVFMDLEMPELDGVDATVEIRGLGFQMPIVAMTATTSKIGKDNAITSGMNDYITKPVKVEAVKIVLLKWFS